MSDFTFEHLIPFLLLGVSLVLFIIYFRNLALVRASEGWPASQGTIVEAWVRKSTSTDEDGASSSTYYPEVRYVYSVMGSEYQGEKIAFGPKSGGARSKAEKVLNKYPKGSTVTVYYDPNKPETAVLERSTSKGLLVSGLIFAAIGVYFFTRVF